MGEPQAREPKSAVLARAAGERDLAVDVGLVIAPSAEGDRAALEAFAGRLAGDVVGELADSTGADWAFHAEEHEPLSDAEARRPSEFLDEAALRMVEGPYDLVVVVTDVPLLARNHRRVAGLASPLSRVVTLSTHRLQTRARDDPTRSLDAPAVRWNGAALLLHEIGHVLGARHDPADKVMAPFEFDDGRERVPEFDVDVERRLARIARRIPEEDVETRSLPRLLWFHLLSAARNPRQLGRALVTSRAPLLPLSLPKLSTAAVAPTLILVFSAETWDVGIHLDNATTALFAAVSVVLATFYLLFSLNLNVPRKRRDVVTEHVALLNIAIVCILALGMVGLFVLVGTIMLVIEFVVFPPDLMTNWPTLENPTVTVVDLLRTGAFISTIGVLSGALAGGLEDRTILRHLALFLARP